ncbi:MAG: DnaJ domain-containing protein [Cyanobacteria bacterium P01_F01_bin.150]
MTHYDTLEINSDASQSDIKHAYRRLAKLFHPDSNQATASHDRITSLNAAYEILSDPTKRRQYDAQMIGSIRFKPPASSQTTYRESPRRRASSKGQDIDAQTQRWIKRVYTPVNRTIGKIINRLKDEVRQLSADPFDDELLDAFQTYLDDCRKGVDQAQARFRSEPNPPSLAGAASNLYYCLAQVGDGVDELERFVSCYDEHYLHTGQELFRIAYKLRQEAQDSLQGMD